MSIEVAQLNEIGQCILSLMTADVFFYLFYSGLLVD